MMKILAIVACLVAVAAAQPNIGRQNGGQSNAMFMGPPRQQQGQQGRQQGQLQNRPQVQPQRRPQGQPQGQFQGRPQGQLQGQRPAVGGRQQGQGQPMPMGRPDNMINQIGGPNQEPMFDQAFQGGPNRPRQPDQMNQIGRDQRPPFRMPPFSQDGQVSDQIGFQDGQDGSQFRPGQPGQGRRPPPPPRRPGQGGRQGPPPQDDGFGSDQVFPAVMPIMEFDDNMGEYPQQRGRNNFF